MVLLKNLGIIIPLFTKERDYAEIGPEDMNEEALAGAEEIQSWPPGFRKGKAGLLNSIIFINIINPLRAEGNQSPRGQIRSFNDYDA